MQEPKHPKAELERRRRELAAREGKSGYSANVELLKERIEELEAQVGPV